ncbi:uncharacterized protein LOC133201646 [Saccostrea echinata]|uniref:uncharacterized protein LOC133201646 n=1 Tax=Saccostrea echinata TaxID=191078 RepID=UPI002A7ED6E9|nr:uncharacterized protein LOC133201646 [Saccostrea echinata]
MTEIPIMDPRYSAQVILLCDVCQTAALQSHCELCHENLCMTCAEKHLSDSSKRHNVVPYKHRTSAPKYPKCPHHSRKYCELYCEKCDIPVCSTCISSGKHKKHHLSNALQKLNSKRKDLEKELKELEETVYPAYEELALDLNSEKLNLEMHYEKLMTAVEKRGEEWHREIDIIINSQKSEIDDMKTKHLVALIKQEKEVKQITSAVNQSVLNLKKILKSNEVSLTSMYRSKNVEFRRLPPRVKVSLPNFSARQINREQLHQMFGSLSALSITTEDHGHTIEAPEAVPFPPVKTLLDEPEFITIDTEYENLFNVTCLSNKKIWTRGDDKIIRLYNLQGKLLNSIQTKSGNYPADIAVTRSGKLVYSDFQERTVNIVKNEKKNEKIQEMIRLQRWKPYGVCSTSSGDLLVTMISDDEKQSKVVRYSDSTEKQTIQFDSEGKPLYSSNNMKHICENRNLDICVSDFGAFAVVVANQAGKFRFRYTGHPFSTTEPFYPQGITTDSQSQILVADYLNNRIQILNQDGQFVRYVDNCDLHLPCGLCVDTRDNLFVTEYDDENGKMKKIKYMLEI